MSLKRIIAYEINELIEPLNLRVERARPTTWDKHFKLWIRAAAESGCDPNDIGDAQWSDDMLDVGLKEHYLPIVSATSTVLELGPGSGRLSRHLVERCGHLILADSSPTACRWLERYLGERGNVSVLRSTGNALIELPGASVDVIIAHGVFEHLDQEDVFLFFLEFMRLLRSPGQVAFNFDALLCDRSPDAIRDQALRKRPERFRFHHPEAVKALARIAGFSHVETFTSSTRIAFARLQRTFS
jgi:SAM-dependent methyltransferase